MGKAVFTPKSHNWRVYEVDDTVAVEAENTKGTIDWNEPIVIHLCIEEEGNAGVNNGDYDAQYSFNTTDWFTPGVQGGSDVVNYDDNPNLTEHAACSQKITGCSTTVEKVHETDCVDIDMGALLHNEIVMCFELNDTTGERTIYFRVVINSTAVPLQGGSSYPQVDSGVYVPPAGQADKKTIGKGIMEGVLN